MKSTQRHPVSSLLAVISLTLALAWALPAPAALIINEVLADPATDWDGDGTVDTMRDEWIEIRNTGAESIDLAEYWLRDGLGETPHLHLDGELSPGQVKVYYGSDATAWQEANGAGATGFSLNNGGDTVELLVNHYVDGNLMWLSVAHSVTYENHEAEDDRSSGWEEDGGAWVLFDSLNPYAGSLLPVGSDCAPTPGAVNHCGTQVSADRATLDEIKASFR